MDSSVKAPRNFREFLGNPRIVDIVSKAQSLGRLPHAMVFAGPEGVGKRTFALLLAQALNCLSPEAIDGCGSCRSCKKIQAESHPDVRVFRPDGAYIKIEQVRALIAEVAYQPFEGNFRIAILDGADQMRQEAANSLLKTLEEPPSRTFIILVTPNPHALLTTIRSRCRTLLFGGLSRDQVEEFLTDRAGRAPLDARLAASLSEGSLARALVFDTERFRELRELAHSFLKLALGNGDFAETSKLASVLAKDKESFRQWLRAVSGFLEEIYFAQVFPARARTQDISGELEELARSASHSLVVSSIEAMNRLRTALLFNVNRQIALESLYLRLKTGDRLR